MAFLVDASCHLGSTTIKVGIEPICEERVQLQRKGPGVDSVAVRAPQILLSHRLLALNYELKHLRPPVIISCGVVLHPRSLANKILQVEDYAYTKC